MTSLVLSVYVSIEHVCLSVIYVAGHVYMDICGVYVCLVCVCMLRIHLQPHYGSDLGT